MAHLTQRHPARGGVHVDLIGFDAIGLHLGRGHVDLHIIQLQTGGQQDGQFLLQAVHAAETGGSILHLQLLAVQIPMQFLVLRQLLAGGFLQDDPVAIVAGHVDRAIDPVDIDILYPAINAGAASGVLLGIGVHIAHGNAAGQQQAQGGQQQEQGDLLHGVHSSFFNPCARGGR